MAKIQVEQEWKKNLHFIARLYIDERCSFADIADRLTKEGLKTSEHNVKLRLTKWGIKRYRHTDELHLMAGRLLHAREHGQSIRFKRLGEDFPTESIEAYLNASPTTKPSGDPLPAYIQAVPVVSVVQEGRPLETQAKLTEGALHTRDSNVPQPGTRTPKLVDETVKRQKRAASSPPQMSRQPQTTTREESDQDECTYDIHNLLDCDSDAFHTDYTPLEAVKVMGNLKRLGLRADTMDSETAQTVNHALHVISTIIYDKNGSSRKKNPTDLGPLHWAAQHEDREIAESLLEEKVDINARGGLLWTPLHIVAMHGHYDLMNRFLQHPNIDVNAIDADGATPLLYAIGGKPSSNFRGIKRPSLGCALLLIGREADVDAGVLHGKTALHLACAASDLDEVVKLISARTKKLDGQDRSGSTALHTALLHRNEDYVRTLMQAGADLNIPDKHGRTPMHLAGIYATAELLSEMIQFEVDFTVKGGDDETILHLVCRRDLHGIATAVAEKPGVDINAKSATGITPLMIAATSGQFETVQMLVKKGADATATDAAMDTALIAAIQRKHKKIIKFLISQSDLEPKNKSVKKWKTQSLYDRKVGQEFSLPVTRASGPPCIRPLSDTCLVEGRTAPSGPVPPNAQTQLMHAPMPTQRSREVMPGSYMLNYGPPNNAVSMQLTGQEPLMPTIASEPYSNGPPGFPVTLNPTFRGNATHINTFDVQYDDEEHGLHHSWMGDPTINGYRSTNAGPRAFQSALP